MLRTEKNKPSVDADEARGFLDAVWGVYGGDGADCYAIVALGDSVRFRHFCLSELGSYGGILDAVSQYLTRELARPGLNVYFQVLPLATKPSSGRGSARDVRVGAWLWADLDFKEAVDKAGFEGCREGEDHALECYYEEGNRWIHVNRPPLSEVLKVVEEKLGVRPAIVVDSGAGYHLYFRLAYTVEAAKLRRLEERLVEALGGDPQSKDLARILRLPGTLNPRVKRFASVILKDVNNVIDPEMLEARLEAGGTTRPAAPARPAALRELGMDEILKVVNLLEEAYRPGYRNSICLYLSGWAAKSGVSPVSVARIIRELYDKTKDGDSLKTRAGALVYSYKKAGVDLGPYADRLREIFGVEPYGLEREIDEERVKGYSGLQGVLEGILGEEKALSAMNELTEILGAPSPHRGDSIIELVGYDRRDRRVYAIANLRRLVMARGVLDEGGMRYREIVAPVAPTEVVAYDSPLGGLRKYEIVFEGRTLRKPLRLGPAQMDEIIDRLRSEGLVYYNKLIADVLPPIVQAFIKYGRGEVKVEIERPGFYILDGRFTAVRYEVGEPDRGRLREALLLLNELADTWYAHARPKFARAVLWGTVAPFVYAMKQLRARGAIPPGHLLLYGDTRTGKTTLGKVLLRMWGLGAAHEKTGGSADTIARLGHVLGSSTFPVLINEPGGMFRNEDVVEALKASAEELVVRGKYVKTTYVEIPALAPLILTSNRSLPGDEALMRRMIVLYFSYGERIPEERQLAFKGGVEPRLASLSEVGRCLAHRVSADYSVLLGGWIDVARKLLSYCYELAGLEAPKWMWEEYAEEESPSPIKVLLERWRDDINRLYSQVVGRTHVPVVDEDGVRRTVPPPVKQKLRELLEANAYPGMVLRGSTVVVNRALLERLGLDMPMKSLAEMLGCEYRPKYAEKREGRLIGYSAAVCDLDHLLGLFDVGEEEQPEVGR